ncbi:MAG: type I restriction-modification system subunit M, partial [Lactobacillaceae bacterium]|nr:type I restriction-modification system subunit M [Lactobacillaceae bacterium]
MITSEEIKRKLMDGANELRGSMDASRYKDYMLGLMFYKFLSDKTLETFKETSGLGVVSEEELLQSYAEAHEAYGDKLDSMIQKVLGYYVLPKHLYQTWLKDIKEGEFELQKVTDSLNDFERTIAVTGDSDDFKGLFSSSIIDMTNTALGTDLTKRSKNIKDLILLFADLNMVELQDGDILGDAYEYLIGQFASDAGKKAGEFYTPHQVSEVMARIVSKNEDISSIYDPTVGSGSLLLTVSKHLNKQNKKDLNYYGQEYITETYNLTRMNLLLHGVRPEKMNIKNGNTLAHDWPEDPQRPNEGVQFDAVVMNPPYSDKKWNKREDKPLKVSDPRFADFGVLPPDNKGDFAYLMHGLYHLGQKGIMSIVLPLGVLFRGGAEGEIRKRLVDKNYVDAIIGLPNSLFTNTSIPVCVIILKKNRDLTAPILMVDASNSFIKVGTQNVLQEKDIAKIVDAYVEKSEIVGYSHLTSREEIQQNDYNMNIPRYVEPINDDVPQDVDAHLYGGIPSQNISELSVLNHIVPEIMKSSFSTVRSGYVEMNKEFLLFSKEVLSNTVVIEQTKKLNNKVIDYSNRWYKKLKTLGKSTELRLIEEEMLTEIKEILSAFPDIDVYDGYQIIAKIWKEALAHDCEYIVLNGFYDS